MKLSLGIRGALTPAIFFCTKGSDAKLTELLNPFITESAAESAAVLLETLPDHISNQLVEIAQKELAAAQKAREGVIRVYTNPREAGVIRALIDLVEQAETRKAELAARQAELTAIFDKSADVNRELITKLTESRAQELKRELTKIVNTELDTQITAKQAAQNAEITADQMAELVGELIGKLVDKYGAAKVSELTELVAGLVSQKEPLYTRSANCVISEKRKLADLVEKLVGAIQKGESAAHLVEAVYKKELDKKQAAAREAEQAAQQAERELDKKQAAAREAKQAAQLAAADLVVAQQAEQKYYRQLVGEYYRAFGK